MIALGFFVSLYNPTCFSVYLFFPEHLGYSVVMIGNVPNRVFFNKELKQKDFIHSNTGALIFR